MSANKVARADACGSPRVLIGDEPGPKVAVACGGRVSCVRGSVPVPWVADAGGGCSPFADDG